MVNVTIYTAGLCSFCDRAKILLQKKGVEFDEINIMEEPDQRPVMIERANGQRTVPQIFIGDKHVGGSDDLHLLDQEGHLDALLGLANKEHSING